MAATDFIELQLARTTAVKRQKSKRIQVQASVVIPCSAGLQPAVSPNCVRQRGQTHGKRGFVKRELTANECRFAEQQSAALRYGFFSRLRGKEMINLPMEWAMVCKQCAALGI
jgi:hypothetical protein